MNDNNVIAICIAIAIICMTSFSIVKEIRQKTCYPPINQGEPSVRHKDF